MDQGRRPFDPRKENDAVTPAIIGAVVSAALAIFGWWLKWKLNRSRRDRELAEAKSAESEEAKGMLGREYGRQKDRDKRLMEIVSGPSDDRAGELLSRRAKATKISRPPSS